MMVCTLLRKKNRISKAELVPNERHYFCMDTFECDVKAKSRVVRCHQNCPTPLRVRYKTVKVKLKIKILRVNWPIINTLLFKKAKDLSFVWAGIVRS